MPMFVNPVRRRVETPPAGHPHVVAIQSLSQIDVAQHQFKIFHEALGAEGYRLGIKYLDAGIYVPRASGVTARSNRASKDPIHILFPKFRPVDHPIDARYPKPPISALDAASCLAGMQEQQKRFKLFEHEDSNGEQMGWPSRIDPFQYSWHASNIYVTPLHSQFYFLSIDDVNSTEKKDILANMGIKPVLIVVSSIADNSENNEQWIVKIPKLPQYRQEQNLIQHFAQHCPKPVDDEAVRLLAQELNKMAGDPEVTSCTRDFRLPGFYQLKKKYIEKGLFHVVSIKHAEHGVCPVATERYYQLHAKLDSASKRRVRPVRRRASQYDHPTEEDGGQPTPIPHVRAGASAPVPPKADADFYPDSPIYMAHAAEIQAHEPDNPKLAPGRSLSKFRVLQRLIVTGSTDFLEKTPLYHDAERYLKGRERSHLYIYLRTENAIGAYENNLPTQPASFQAHYQNALAFFHDHENSARAAARRMFYMRHSRSVIERSLLEAGIPADNAVAWALEACSPSNAQIHRDSRYFEIWSHIEPRPAPKPQIGPRTGTTTFYQKRAQAIAQKRQSTSPLPTP